MVAIEVNGPAAATGKLGQRTNARKRERAARKMVLVEGASPS